MKTVTMDTPSQDLLDIGSYHLAMLKSEESTQVLAEDFQYIQDNLRKTRDAFSEKHEKTLNCLALKNRNDHLLDKEVMAFEKALLESLGKDRKNPVYKKIFPSGRFKVTKLPINKVMEAVILLEKTIDGSEIDDSLKSFGESLKIRRQSLHESLNSYRAALRSEGESRVELQLAKEEWLRLYAICQNLVKNVYSNDPDMFGCFFPDF